MYQEAFRIAAEKAKAAADSLKVNMKSKAGDIGGCVSNPTPTDGDLKDITIVMPGTKPVILNLVSNALVFRVRLKAYNYFYAFGYMLVLHRLSKYTSGHSFIFISL